VTCRIRPFLCPALVTLALSAPVSVAAGDDAAARPRLSVPYTQFTLANGLRVVLHEDHSVPVVAVNVWYHAGSGREKPGRTGFAHLFEHLMFEGSGHVKEGDFDNLLEGAGGDNNGSTNTDRTNYYLNVPSSALELALFLESDRMGYLLDAMSPGKVDGQRDVVKNERRQGVENQPYGRLSEIIYDHAFTNHPYKHPTIGTMADLEAASISDVRDFHSIYYVPENATITVVGDFDSLQALQMMTQYFARVPKGTKPVPRDIPKEPQQTKERRAVVEESWPLPAVVVAYHVTYDGHPDAYPLHITAKIMSDGQSARIPLELMYKKRLALTAFGSGFTWGSAAIRW